MKKIFLILNVSAGLIGHFLMFFLWRYFFNITSYSGQFTIAGVLFLAIFLTILAPILIQQRDSYFNRALYLITSLWLGFIANSILVATALILLTYILSLFQAQLIFPFYFQQLFIIFLPLIMIPVEVINALDHYIKEVEIKIQDLPEAWEGKRVVHLTDIHLGPIYRRNTFIKIIKKVNKLKPEAVFITGDLFDGMEADFSWFKNSCQDVKAPRGVYYSFGNHDLSLGKEKVRQLLKDSSIQILDDETKLVAGLQIVGVTCLFDRRMKFKETIKEQAGYQEDKPSILLFHEPRYIKEAQAVGIDLQLSGHTHNGQMFPGNIIAHFLYRGYGHGVYRKKNGYNIIVSAGTGTGGPPLRIGHRSEIILITLKRK